VKHGPYACLGFPASSQVTTDSLIAGLLAFTVAGQDFPQEQNQSRSESFNDGDAIGVSVCLSVRGFQGDIPEAGNQSAATAIVGIAVYCRTFPLGEIKYYARVSLYSAARFFFESLGFTTTGVWNRSYYGELEIPASCILSPDRSCIPFNQEAAHIATPLTITLNGDGTCSLGNLTLIGDGGSEGIPPDFPYAKDAVDAILDGISYTFRITSRPNCKPPVACDCNHVDLRGLIIDFAGRSFEIGKYVDEEVDGVRFVSGQNPSGYTVISETSAGGFPQDTTQIDMTCTESGGWMVLMSTRCRRRVDGQLVSDTTDQWAGVMQCSESCDGFYEAASEPGLFQVRTAGEPIPLGEAQDVEYLGRQSSAVECEPPARPTFSIRQVEFC
jgi:hypothetical protein